MNNVNKRRQWHVPLALIGVITLLITGVSRTAHAEPPGGTAGWTRTFNEDFNGMTKNGESFTTPSGNKWATCFFWGTGEIFDGSGNFYSGRDMYVSNGNLVMPVVRNPDGSFNGSLANSDPNVSGQTSAGTFSQLYGYWEARVKISMTDGDAPYFGLPPVSHAWPPEIEIFEIPGGWSRLGQRVHFLSMTGTDDANKAPGTWEPGNGFRFQDDYHLFACRWEPGVMIFYVDGVERFRTEKGVPAEPSFLNLGHGCGSDGGLWNGNNQNGTWPQNTLVDYVRVWRNTGNVPIPPVPEGEPFQNLGWVATASVSGGGAASNAVDWDPWTRWASGGRVTGGEWLSLNFGRKLYFNRIVLDATGFAGDHARGVSVYVSDDGANWGAPVYSGAGSVTDGVHTISVPNQNAQYVRVVNSGDSGSNWWSVGSVRIISSGGPVSPPVGSVPMGQTIAIKSLNNGYFISTDLGQSLSPVRAGWATGVGSWERYRLDDAGNGQVALFSLSNSRYVSVDNTRSDKLLRAAWATSIGDWEKFNWEPRSGNGFAIKSIVTGKYVSSNLGDGGNLWAQWADSVGGWEEFEWQLN
ncbi:MAG: discoidin domain-containing protein [Akkermansiaceae bacterium]|nr:discoidin domain-containing protein [Armatimonadota bacterium]